MHYSVVKMNENYAREVIKWRYTGVHEVYSFEDNEETFNELVNLDYYVVINSNNELEGFFCMGKAAIVPYGKRFGVYDDRSYLDIGIGLNPENVGKRKGYPFFMYCINYIKKEFKINRFRLTVYDFNKSAIQVYHRSGFQIVNFFMGTTGNYFLIMTLID